MWYRVEKNEDKTFSIKMTNAFYGKMTPYYHGGSYLNVMYRLFGLLPQDFYQYCGFAYNASFRKSDCIRDVKMFWHNESDIKKFCAELNRRFDVCVKRGDFSS